MKFNCKRESPKTKYYLECHEFDIDFFSSEVSHQLDSTFCSIKENIDCEELYEVSRFHKVFLNLLNTQVLFSLQKTHICVFPDCFNFSDFLAISYCFLEIKTKLIKSCTKFQAKQIKFLPSKCAAQQTIRAKLFGFFQIFYKTMCALRVKKKKLRGNNSPFMTKTKVNPKLVSDNEHFWRTIIPYFSDKRQFF